MKIYFVILFLLNACVEMSKPTALDSKSVAEVKREKNAKCLDIYKVKVLQVLDDGSALAHECTKDSLSENCYGKVVALIPQRKFEYYDEMIVEPEVEKCFVQDGTFRYEAKSGMKTVPVITFDYKYKASTDEEFLKRFSETTKDIKFFCKTSLKQSKNKQDSEKCVCVADAMETMILELTTIKNISDKETLKKELQIRLGINEDILDEEIFEKELKKFIEKKCGKIDF